MCKIYKINEKLYAKGKIFQMISMQSLKDVLFKK